MSLRHRTTDPTPASNVLDRVVDLAARALARHDWRSAELWLAIASALIAPHSP